METETGLNNVSLTIKDNILILEREKGFFSLDTFNAGIGMGDVRSIITYSLKSQEDPAPSNTTERDEDLKILPRDVQVLKPATVAFGNFNIKNGVNKTQNGVTTIVTAGKNVNMPLCITVLIEEKLSETTLTELFQSIVELKTDILSDLGLKNVNQENNNSNIDLEYNSSSDQIILACSGRGDINSDQEIDEIHLMVRRCLKEALSEQLKNFGYPRDIMGHILDAGVTIEDLIDAGMQLCVGVERNKTLDVKLKKQLLKSLEDLNVAALIMAGVRLEEDFSRSRIRGIDVSDDPAYLYSDEVLGLAVANQIAGTKAIFNFKRYDEEKPGIIGTLGPFLDDVFAGLVAGCMSKIFEE